MFDTVIKYVPELHDRLSPDAQIVENTSFETAIVKIQTNRHSYLSDNIKPLLIYSKVVDDASTNEDNLAEIAMKEFNEQLKTTSDHMDSKLLLPTSNSCERLFSVSRRAMTDYRK